MSLVIRTYLSADEIEYHQKENITRIKDLDEN